jgi:hypothetical protein
MADPLPGEASDQVPAVMASGRGDVAAAVFSMSARSPNGHDARYLEWHCLDHIPEQYRIEGIRHGARWVSTPACRAARALQGGALDAVDHVVNYLAAPPVARTFEQAYELMVALDGVGRMPPLRPPQVYVGLFGLAGKVAAPRVVAGADVMPWRPARGVYLIVERTLDQSGDDRPAQLDSLVALDGVAGVWRYEGGFADRNPAQVDSPAAHRIAVCYLDGDPVDVATHIAPALRARWSGGGIDPLLAGPFQAVVPWEWDRSLP